MRANGRAGGRRPRYRGRPALGLAEHASDLGEPASFPRLVGNFVAPPPGLATPKRLSVTGDSSRIVVDFSHPNHFCRSWGQRFCKETLNGLEIQDIQTALEQKRIERDGDSAGNGPRSFAASIAKIGAKSMQSAAAFRVADAADKVADAASATASAIYVSRTGIAVLGAQSSVLKQCPDGR
eukprot:SAG11_NODE_629_length_8073_cov_6.782042_1_plen_181_part_00